MLVCGSSFAKLRISQLLNDCDSLFVYFSEYSANPSFDEICRGVDLFLAKECDGIIAVGGGSAIDTAKCVKLFSGMDPSLPYLAQPLVDSGIPFLAIPTTAGSGSEATSFAVLYKEGIKKSVEHSSLLPNCVIFAPYALNTLPQYQRKCTVLDAVCHSVESWWSVNSTNESVECSKKALKLILKNAPDYISMNNTHNGEMLAAANYAGQAINITRTTAAHALCYGITKKYAIPHGHAAALCLPKVWRYMLNHMNMCRDNRGTENLNLVFTDIANFFGFENALNCIVSFESTLLEWNIQPPQDATAEDAEKLSGSVNAERLSNNPVRISEEDFALLYSEILGAKGVKL